MKNLLALIFALAAAIPARAYEDRNLLQAAADRARLAEVLICDRSWVDYPAYTDRAGWDALTGANKEALIDHGERFLDYKWQVVTATSYLEFTRSGNRQVMQSVYDGNTGAMTALFVAEMAEGRGRFIDQLINGIFHTCEMTTWANSAHLPLQRAGGSFPAAGDHVIDLAAGDVGSTLAWIHYFLHDEFDKITPLIAQRIESEVKARIIDTYINETRFWWMAADASESNPRFVNNWNPWCNTGVLLCLLLIEEDRQKMMDGVWKTLVSVDKFINYTKSDGACEEGPSYWGHAAGKMYDYLQILSDATAGRVSIFDQPIVRNMGEYIVRSHAGNGWVVNFADAEARASFDSGLIYRYGTAVGSDLMRQFAAWARAEKLSRPISIARDMYRTLGDIACDGAIAQTAPHYSAAPFTWYPQTQFCYIAEGDWFFAAKGGHNDESHNHNDVGSFSLYHRRTPILIDAGTGTYTAKTFSSSRYDIWTMQSRYHNLPEINGAMQLNGRDFNATDARADSRTFAVDIAGAYPAATGVKRWTRTYRVSKGGVELTDDFELREALAPSRVNFLTWGAVDLSTAGVVRITVDGQTYALTYDRSKFEATTETVALSDVRLSKFWGPQVARIILTATTLPTRATHRFAIRLE